MPIRPPNPRLASDRASWAFLARSGGIGLVYNHPGFIREGGLRSSWPKPSPTSPQRSPSSLPALSLLFLCSALSFVVPTKQAPRASLFVDPASTEGLVLGAFLRRITLRVIALPYALEFSKPDPRHLPHHSSNQGAKKEPCIPLAVEGKGNQSHAQPVSNL